MAAKRAATPILGFAEMRGRNAPPHLIWVLITGGDDYKIEIAIAPHIHKVTNLGKIWTVTFAISLIP